MQNVIRPVFHWRLRKRTITLGERTLVMGIVNVTPDSFSDGGDFLSTSSAVAHAMKLLREGADIVDIGGESTRPGKKKAVSEQEELDRVLPVIGGILAKIPKALVSVDTYKSGVAKAAVEAGAEIVNDVSAFAWDKEMPTTVASLKCGAILMHMRGRPEEWRSQPRDPDIVATASRELAASSRNAEAAGVAKDAIVLDPGFGFGKNFEENYPLLAHFERLHALGYPLLSGTSRKSFIGRTLAVAGQDAALKERLVGTMATVTASVLKGTHIVRVHDVKEAAETVKIADAILNAGRSRSS
ncbi:MAG TPA: dihydropteroate synthase [Terriglobales bacterium]|nr:dihydropteroate synthase [Terriglobales bacterium]